MEYLEYGDLHHYLLESPPLPEQEAGDITFQILEGLAFMHENGFAHRDLKPAVRRLYDTIVSNMHHKLIINPEYSSKVKTSEYLVGKNR
jgi:calcium/calmodulin-dependent protein kinase I